MMFALLALMASVLVGEHKNVAYAQTASASSLQTASSEQGDVSGIAAQSSSADREYFKSEEESVTIDLKCGSEKLAHLTFTGMDNCAFSEGLSPVVLHFFDLSCDVGQYVDRHYTNFRLSNSLSDGSYSCYFKIIGTVLHFESVEYGSMYSTYNLQNEIDNNKVDIICDFEPPVVSLPEEPTKEGYTFAGWYYGLNENCNQNCTEYRGEPIYEDTDLHAHWTINTYTVTFDTAGGPVVQSATVEWNKGVAITTPKRVGYNFLGWYLADGTQYTNQPIKADTKLTARWEIKTFTVSFYVGDEKYKELTVEYGTTLSDAMDAANIVSYQAMNMDGKRLSKASSVITEDTEVLVEKLTGWEKYGDFVGRNPWYTWVIVGLGGVLTIFAIIGIVLMVKRG